MHVTVPVLKPVKHDISPNTVQPRRCWEETCVCEDTILLGYDVGTLCNQFPVFQKEYSAFLFKGLRVLRKLTTLSPPYTGMNLHTTCCTLHTTFKVDRGAPLQG